MPVRRCTGTWPQLPNRNEPRQVMSHGALLMTNTILTVEEWAKEIIQHELGLPVVLNDTGKEPGMYDLRIGAPDAPEVAIECIRAVDPIRQETWNVGAGKGPIRCALESDWVVETTPEARIKSIRDRIESLLRACEQAGLYHIAEINWQLRDSYPDICREMENLSIVSVNQVDTNGDGNVFLLMTGVGGVVHTGADVPKWIAVFLLAPERADVLLKLRKSNAKHCHVFVHVSLGGAPWEVESYLSDGARTLPTIQPILPYPVSAVWLTYARFGLRWDGASWKSFKNPDR